MTTQMTSLNPSHVDMVRAELDGKLAPLNSRVHSITDILHTLVGDKRDRHGAWGMADTFARNAARTAVDKHYDGHERIAKYLAELAEVTTEMSKIFAAIDALDAVFEAAGGWNRFWLVPDGHAHRNENCQTLHREGKRTRLDWLPELAGHDEAEAIEEFGEQICTVCIPSAPTNPAFNGPGRRARAEVEAKAAEKAAKQAVKDAKAITNPDGTPLKLTGRFGDTINTLVTAQRTLLDEMWTIGFYGGIPEYANNDQSEHYANIELLVAAIAAKTGEAPKTIRATAQAKADKKVKKDLK